MSAALLKSALFILVISSISIMVFYSDLLFSVSPDVVAHHEQQIMLIQETNNEVPVNRRVDTDLDEMQTNSPNGVVPRMKAEMAAPVQTAQVASTRPATGEPSPPTAAPTRFAATLASLRREVGVQTEPPQFVPIPKREAMALVPTPQATATSQAATPTLEPTGLFVYPPEPTPTPAPTEMHTAISPTVVVSNASQTPAPPPSPTIDPWFPSVVPYPLHAATHNESFIMRSFSFENDISREKGIMICLHDKVIAMGLSLIKELRCLGNQELIQVYHCLPQDLSLASRKLLLSQDDRLEIIDVCSDLIQARVFTPEQAGSFVNWWVKPLAVHHTNLQHVLLLDADDTLLHDPAVLRMSTGYQQNGTMFFYDRVIEDRNFLKKEILGRQPAQTLQYIVHAIDYKAFDLGGPKPSQHLLNSFAYQDKSCHEQDSSMVVIDKTRPGKAMDLLWYLITQLRFTMEYSWGDKESYWLAYALAHQPYAFSPWGVSVVSSSASQDMEESNYTLCGSIAQYIPAPHDTEPQLLYVNGRALLDPLAQGVGNLQATANLLYNTNPTHVVPRMARQPRKPVVQKYWKKSMTAFQAECLIGHGSTPLPSAFMGQLFRRRLHYLAISSGVVEPLGQCEFRWG